MVVSEGWGGGYIDVFASGWKNYRFYSDFSKFLECSQWIIPELSRKFSKFLECSTMEYSRTFSACNNCRFYSDFSLRFNEFNSFYIDISFLSNLHPRLTFAGGSPVLYRWQGRFIHRRPLCIRFNYPSLRYLIDLTQCKLWLR